MARTFTIPEPPDETICSCGTKKYCIGAGMLVCHYCDID